jgi:polyisoprenoid-binding protein YceI
VRLIRFCSFLVLNTLLLSAVAAAQTADTAPQRSAITIRVFKAGLFSGLAHNHVVVAPIAQAKVDPAGLTAEIMVVTKEMKVTDPDVSEKDRAEIQGTMLGPKVLDQENFPEIRFRSSRIEQTSPQHYRVVGLLEA